MSASDDCAECGSMKTSIEYLKEDKIKATADRKDISTELKGKVGMRLFIAVLTILAIVLTGISATQWTILSEIGQVKTQTAVTANTLKMMNK